MKIFPPDPHVELYNEGFEEDDILHRASVGKALSDLVERIEDPLVVALDGDWGTGKTYFLKRWVGAHELQNEGKATTVYFDAFANDYISDPLPALVSALTERFPKTDKKTLNKIKAAAFKFTKPLARIGLAIATHGATEAVSDFGDSAVNAVSSEASNTLEKYWEREDGRRAAMQEFRSSLTELVAIPSDDDGSSTGKSAAGSGARLVIVIDELDRCRPDYGLEVLEVIKHFFSIPGVIFVLGVNLRALENSVKARYGSDIDASGYLKKFVTATLSLPSEIGPHHNLNYPTVDVYLDHQLSEMGIPDKFADDLKSHIRILIRRNKISIRDIGKILSSISLLDNKMINGQILSGWTNIAITLLVSKIVNPRIYQNFLDANVNSECLENYFDATFTRISRECRYEYQSGYDEYTWYIYNCWMYLVENGEFEGESREEVRALGNQFSQAGWPDNPRTIPKTTHQRWLDLLSLTET